MELLFQNALVLTMDDNRPVIQGGFVGVSGHNIVYLGTEKPREPANRTVDCKGDILMPGLVNAHTHAAMCLMRGYADDYPLHTWLFDKVFPVEARLTEEAILAGARLAFAEMIRTGTTSISDMYFHQPRVAALAMETGMRVSLCNGIVALDGALHKDDRAFVELAELLRDFHGRGDGLVRADASIHGEYTSTPGAWRYAAELAKERGLVLHLHLSETKKEHEECLARRGVTPARAFYENGVFEAKTMAAHCVWVSEDDRELLSACGVSAVHNPVSNLKLGSGIAPVADLMKHGVNVALGTDGCCSNNSHDLFEEIKLAALLQKGATHNPTAVTAYQTLKMATVNGAKAQGREDYIGKVEPGMRADLILINTRSPGMQPVYSPQSAVAYAARGSDVRLTMINGKILYENGRFTTIDVERAMNDANQAAKTIVLGE